MGKCKKGWWVMLIYYVACSGWVEEKGFLFRIETANKTTSLVSGNGNYGTTRRVHLISLFPCFYSHIYLHLHVPCFMCTSYVSDGCYNAESNTTSLNHLYKSTPPNL